MKDTLSARLKQYERNLRAKFGGDISTPEARRAAWWTFQLLDHAFLRYWWTNFAQVAPGVFRSNQPHPGRLERHARRGMRAVLNLRGASQNPHYLFEREACDALGLHLHDLQISARTLSEPGRYLELLDAFETLPKPFVMHCKSGADRAGLASAMYLIHIEGMPLAEAKEQLSLRFIHLKNAPTGILDHFLTVFGRAQAETGISLRDWIATGYDRAAVTDEFNAMRRDGVKIT